MNRTSVRAHRAEEETAILEPTAKRSLCHRSLHCTTQTPANAVKFEHDETHNLCNTRLSVVLYCTRVGLVAP